MTTAKATQMGKTDLVIIGGGPAALSAAIYAGRAGVAPTVFEAGALGGTLTQIAEIENYPGFIGTGAELAANLRRQAELAGAKLEYGTCNTVRRSAEGFELEIDGARYFARAIIAATGARPRPLELSLDVPVSYCALCDGSLAREKRIAVVGGGNSAFQEALYLAELVKSLTLITHSRVKADAILVERLRRYPNVEIRENLEPTAELLNKFDYVFVFIGKQPATEWLQDLDQSLPGAEHQAPTQNSTGQGSQSIAQNLARKGLLLDPAGYIIAPENRAALAGLFAAGDVRAGALRQAVVASADGASAALATIAYLQQIAQK